MPTSSRQPIPAQEHAAAQQLALYELFEAPDPSRLTLNALWGIMARRYPALAHKFVQEANRLRDSPAMDPGDAFLKGAATLIYALDQPEQTVEDVKALQALFALEPSPTDPPLE